MSDITISDATPEDIYGIREVQKQSWLATYPNEGLGITANDISCRFSQDDTPEGKLQMERRKQSLLDPSIHVWVAKDSAEIVGFCTAVRETSSGKIGAIYLLPSYQGQGIGGELMRQALEWLRADQAVYVHVVSYNTQAIQFYQHFGFTLTGKEVTDAVAALPSGKILPEIEMVLER